MSNWAKRRTGQVRERRRGEVFPIRVTAEQRAALEKMRDETAGPRALGPFVVWAALNSGTVLPGRPGNTRAPVLPARYGNTVPRSFCDREGNTVAGALKILDLCAGSGAWSEPYERAGYEVVKVTLPENDVREFVPPVGVHGVLAAPPCDQFSLARNGHKSPRNLFAALEVVCACLRVIALARPSWWALENPVGLVGKWLGTPRDVFQPHEFGDPWTKRTALWGNFTIPTRGPFVTPTTSAMKRSTAALRAVTPSGFANAFFAANP